MEFASSPSHASPVTSAGSPLASSGSVDELSSFEVRVRSMQAHASFWTWTEIVSSPSSSGLMSLKLKKTRPLSKSDSGKLVLHGEPTTGNGATPCQTKFGVDVEP